MTSPITNPAGIDSRCLSIMMAIGHMEGSFVTSNGTYRRHNPGNIRKWGTLPIVNGYIQCNNMADGCLVLYKDVLANKGKTLRFFIEKFAPVKDNNNTNEYMNFVSLWTGIGLDDSI